jgi:exonuclease SbcD
VLDHALRGFAAARVPVLLTSGNHDSAVRLGFGSRLSELAGVHLRTAVADVARPVLLADEYGEVALYGIPYLLPDAVMADLGAERSHASVLAAAIQLIKADAQERGVARTVVAAHARHGGCRLGVRARHQGRRHRRRARVAVCLPTTSRSATCMASRT